MKDGKIWKAVNIDTDHMMIPQSALSWLRCPRLDPKKKRRES
jgi:hypothetical protein